MNDKKDDSEGRYDPGDDTASLLESLFKDTKSSEIKVVRRRIRPKSVVKKRVVSRERRDQGKATSQTTSQKLRRPSPSVKSTGATQSKTLPPKRPLPGSVAQKDSRIEQRRQKLRRKSAAGSKPGFKPSESGGKRIVRPGGPKNEPPPSKTITGSGDERTESLNQSVLNSMISMAAGIKGSRNTRYHELSPEERYRLKIKKDGGEKTSKEDDRSRPPADIEVIPGTDEEITEIMGKTTLDSMISELEMSGKKGDGKASAEESPVPEEEDAGVEIFFDSDDSREETSSDIESITGADEDITEVLQKTTLDSMISELEMSGKKGDGKASAEESPVPEEEDAGVEIFFDSDDSREETSSDIESITGADEDITEVLQKTTLDSMISELEVSGKKGDKKASAEESPVPEEEDTGIEIFFDSDDSREETSSDIESITGADGEITELLEKSALSTMISALEGSEKQGDEKASAGESSASEEEEVDVGIALDSDDLKEEVSADIEGIDGAAEEGPLFQEKPAAPSAIIIEDSLPEASKQEIYPESTFEYEEESIPEDRKEDVEEAPQSIDFVEEQPSDSANAEMTKEKTLSQEKPAAFTPILSKTSGIEANVFEVHHILEDKERPILEDKKEDIERTSEAVGMEIEPLSDSSEPAKEEPRLKEILMPSLMSSEDSKVSTDEEEHHHKPEAEEGSVPEGEDEFERVSESVKPEKEEPADLEEGVALTEEDLQLIRRSGHRSKVIRIGLPLILFGILAIILGIRYSPLDFFKHEQAQKLMSDKSVEVSSPKKQGVTPKTLREKSPVTRQGIQPSTPASVEKEIVRAHVPRKRNAGPETQKETVKAVIPEVKPSTSEPPTILAMKESVEGSSPLDQNTTSTTPKRTLITTDLEVQPQPPEPATPPPPGDASVKAESNQIKTSISHPFSVYLGSYSTLKSTEKAISKYNENGLSSLYWQEVDLGDKGIWYRVFTGQFETRSEAEEYVKERQLVDAEVRKIEPGALVGSGSVKNVAPQVKTHKKQGVIPEAAPEFSYPYSVYVGSYKNLDRARKAASELKTKGASYWVKTDLGEKGIWYRVYIGCFQTKDQAETFINNYQIADGESRRTTYANLIGTYSSEEELDRMRLSLLNLEFSPYVIEASDGKSHLFTGAFYQKADAEKAQLDLNTKGIKSQLVER